jgi:hypothetical protein
MPQGDRCWVEWAKNLRVQMMTQKLPAVVKSTSDVHRETGTHEPLTNLQSRGFWNSCQRGGTDWDALTKAGFELDFEPDENGKVQLVTFRLNSTWLGIM